MACELCKKNATAHSFTDCGKAGTAKVYYTAPAKATETLKSHTDYFHFKKHLDGIHAHPWVWLFDCEGMKTHHFLPFDLCKDLLQTVLYEHGSSLQEIWILRPNIWIKGVMKLLQPVFPDLFKKVKMLQGDGIELILALEARGVRGSTLQSVRQKCF